MDERYSDEWMREQLSRMIDESTLTDVLLALADVCETNAREIEINCRDDKVMQELVPHWEHAAKLIREVHARTAEI